MSGISKFPALSKAEYLQFRDLYIPKTIKLVFVLESPPASGRYFYNPDGATSEPLFRAMMKDVMEIDPSSKAQGLREFADRGFFLVDATYTPVNDCNGRVRDTTIVRDLPLLVETLQTYARPNTQVVLVKANVCRLLEAKLLQLGFNVINQGAMIPFPSSGQQNNFRAAVRSVLGFRAPHEKRLSWVGLSDLGFSRTPH